MNKLGCGSYHCIYLSSTGYWNNYTYKNTTGESDLIGIMWDCQLGFVNPSPEECIVYHINDKPKRKCYGGVENANIRTKN